MMKKRYADEKADIPNGDERWEQSWKRYEMERRETGIRVP
jgi:hypothetical protein